MSDKLPPQQQLFFEDNLKETKQELPPKQDVPSKQDAATKKIQGEKTEIREQETAEKGKETDSNGTKQGIAENETKKKNGADQKNPYVPDTKGPLKRLMEYNFLEYASYVICDRAIPCIEDGLKPVQRRIMHSLHDKDDGRFIKVANVVGHCMQYHPHGDASIADALVTLTNKRYLIEGQGNFGNIYTGDPAAAPRYIECRLTDLARKELLNSELTEFVPSYDGRNKEPVLLPSKLPLLLMLGAEGIAVGMSTSILPYNFPELIEAQIAILQKKPFNVLPDFQQGGMMDVSEFQDGNGRIRMRAKITEHDTRVVIRELPYGQTTDTLVASIEDAVRKKKVPVRAINDFTAENVEIELVLSKETKPANAIKALYAFTNCESSITGRIVVLRNNRPAEMTTSEILKINTEQLRDILKKELELQQHKLEESLHQKTLVQIFVEERIYKRIEQCKTYEKVVEAIRNGLEPFQNQFKRAITDEDIEMLLGIRIRRISLFDINKNKQEIDDIVKELEKVRKHLTRLTPYTIHYLQGILKEYADKYPRKTKVATFSNIEIKKLTAEELEIKHDKQSFYVGTAVDGEPVFKCSSLDKLIFVWNDGRYKVVNPPEKMFVDENIIYCAKMDRDREFTAVYTHGQFTYIKRFTFGGTIMNKEYLLTPEDSFVHLLSDTPIEKIYLKYRPAKGQRIHQQVFDPTKVAVKGVKARGNQMTGKVIARISTRQEKWWEDDDGATPAGTLL